MGGKVTSEKFFRDKLGGLAAILADIDTTARRQLCQANGYKRGFHRRHDRTARWVYHPGVVVGIDPLNPYHTM